jgi:hypothetical protein
MSGEWVIYNRAGESADTDCFVVAPVRARGTVPYFPARCRECNCSTMVQQIDTHGSYECVRCGEIVEWEDVKFPRTQAALIEEIAAALFPAVCAFCGEEMIASYASLDVIDCRGGGSCDKRAVVLQ